MARKKKSGKRKSSSRRRTNARRKTRGGTRSKRKSSRSRSSSRRKKSKRDFSLNLQQKALITGIAVIFITAVLVLSLLSPNQGELTAALSRLMWFVFGWGGFFFPLIIGAIGLYLVLWGMEQPPQLPVYRLLGLGLLFFTFQAFASMVLVMLDNGLSNVWSVAQAQTGGGYLGGALAFALTRAVGNLGAVFTLVVVGILGAILVSGVTRADVGQFLRNLARRRTAAETATVPVADREIPLNPDRQPRPAVANSAPAKTAPAPEVDTEEAEEAKEPASKSKPRRKAKPEPESSQEAPTEPTPVFLGNDGRAATYSWKLPELTEILDPGSEQDLSNATIREQVEIIEHTLESFGAPATVVEINQGPTITQFGVEPSFIERRSGKRTKVKVGKIASLADDLALALAAQSIRIQAPVPGKGYVGVEVPNTAKALVSLRDIMEAAEFTRINSKLRIGLGQNVAGQPKAANLATMPHLLIAGATGSGKSVCVNSIIACLLLQNTPEELKLVMVDPKRVELTGYNGIPHLAAPVVVDMERVIGVLQWALREMDKRYKLFADIGARNIDDYNKKIKDKEDASRLPYIVIIVDELADLMMLSPEDTERGVTRLAQMARATGIHMIIATQRPSVDVVTGLIKANFPARIAFAVASGTDSRVILDTTGAERLLGQGDMLYQGPDAAAPVRLQGSFVSDKELRKLIDYWKGARRFNLISAESDAVPKASVAADNGERETPTKAVDSVQQPLWEELQKAEEEAQYEDELMPEAIELVRKLNKASTSLLQRRLRIGYTRAARLIDNMEEQGIIGPPTGTSKAREVLPVADDEAEAEQPEDSDESAERENEGAAQE